MIAARLLQNSVEHLLTVISTGTNGRFVREVEKSGSCLIDQFARFLTVRQLLRNRAYFPFGLSLSKPNRIAFDRLRPNGVKVFASQVSFTQREYKVVALLGMTVPLYTVLDLQLPLPGEN